MRIMMRIYRKSWCLGMFATGIAILLTGGRSDAQSGELQQRLADVKSATAQNKQNLATYTWQEKDTVSVKRETKKEDLLRR